MILRDIDFGHVLGGSGVQNFHGQGWPHHRLARFVGLSFDGVTLVSKTSTLAQRDGNMPLDDRQMPRELLPACIHVSVRSWLQGAMLNAVNLSGPGLEALLKEGTWQAWPRPFFISLMALGAMDDKLAQLQSCMFLLKRYMSGARSPWGIQVNLSCPNTGEHKGDLVREAHATHDIFEPLGVPVMDKYGLTTPPEDVVEIARHPACDGACIPNAPKWGELPDDIAWQRIFGSSVSPLARFGGGGLSGLPLRALTRRWTRAVRTAGYRKALNVGNIHCQRDVDEARADGASSIFIASVAILRPWRVRGIVNHANRVFATQ